MAGRLIVAAGAFVVLLSSCAPDPGFDIDALEISIADVLLPVVVENVNCPQLQRSEAQRVICLGSIVGVDVELTVDVAIDGEAEVTVDAPLLDVVAVATEAGTRLSTDLGVDAAVDCEVAVVVIVPGGGVACTVTDLGSGVVRPLTITMIDSDGTWEMDLTP